MIKLISAVLFTIIVVAFSMANAHHIELSVIFGKPVEIRLIFLLASSYALGAVTTMFYTMVRQLKRKQDTRLAKWSPPPDITSPNP